MRYNHILLAIFAFLAGLSLFASASTSTAERFDGHWPFRGARRGLIGGLGKGGKGRKGGDRSPFIPTIPGGSGFGAIGSGEGRVIGGVPDAPKTTIESWGLQRRPLAYNDIVDNPQYMNSFTGNVGGTQTWQKLQITDLNQRPVNIYLSAPLDGAYVTKYINTGNVAGQPKNMMSARDMMAENYVNSGGDLAILKYIGTDDIVEESKVPAIQAAFVTLGKDFRAERNNVDFTPGGPGWNEFSNNALVQGQIKMLEERAGVIGDARIGHDSVTTGVFRWDPDRTIISMVAVLVR